MAFKIHAAANGNFFLGDDGDGATPFDFDASLHAVKIDGNKYVLEVALPMNNLAAGKDFGFSLQVNDIVVEDASSGNASGSQTMEYIFTCVADEVVAAVAEPEPEPEPVAEPVVEIAQEAPVEVIAAAPQTADLTSVACAALAIAVCGVIVSKKRF